MTSDERNWFEKLNQDFTRFVMLKQWAAKKTTGTGMEEDEDGPPPAKMAKTEDGDDSYLVLCAYDNRNACFANPDGHCVYVTREQLSARPYTP